MLNNITNSFSTFRPEYLPSLEYFWKIAQCDSVVFTDHLQYSKRSPVSISPPLIDEESRLRIPVSHKPMLQPICLKQVDDHSNWRQRHFKTLKHSFHNFPYGYYYLPLLNDFYQAESSNLADLLHSLNLQIIQWLHLKCRLYRSKDHQINKDPHSFIKYWQHKLGSSNYMISHEVVKNQWINPSVLNDQKVEFRFFPDFPDYHILESFREKSIISFLMQFGPEAGYIICQYMD